MNCLQTNLTDQSCKLHTTAIYYLSIKLTTLVLPYCQTYIDFYKQPKYEKTNTNQLKVMAASVRMCVRVLKYWQNNVTMRKQPSPNESHASNCCRHKFTTLQQLCLYSKNKPHGHVMWLLKYK